MHARFTAFVFVTLASSSFAGSLDLCENVERRRSEIIQLFDCVQSKASAELVDELNELKPKLLCTNFYIVVKKVCRSKPFAEFMRIYLRNEELYSEFEKLVQHCHNGALTARAEPAQEKPAPGLWNRIAYYTKWLVAKACSIKDAIIGRFTSSKASLV